jgi:hypothetical protein
MDPLGYRQHKLSKNFYAGRSGTEKIGEGWFFNHQFHAQAQPATLTREIPNICLK